MHTDPVLLEWLLDSDPALQWQVQRDLADAPEEEWQDTRSRVAGEGIGARLLSLQDEDGQWAGGAFFPGDFDFDNPTAHEDAGQPWTATTWSLNSLREWGVDAGALTGTAQKLAQNSRWEYDNLPYWGGEVDCCINAFTLANGVWLGADITQLARWFPKHQQGDGGWNCEWVEGSRRSSFISTLNVLKGLLYYEAMTGDIDVFREARRKGEEYLLRRQLLYRLSTGERLAPWATHFAYPFRAAYSALNAADYFRAAALHDGTTPDARIGDAIQVIRQARKQDGTWLQEHRHAGAVWFDVDVPVGEPSKWLTFYSARVLRWWDGA